jgi:uracil-DNA glycosylase
LSESPQWLSFVRVTFFDDPENFARFERLARYVEVKNKAKSLCPQSQDDTFRAWQYTPLEHIKVVVLGQDPYPNQSHAMGLAFSVPSTVRALPASLQNILHLAYVDAKAPNPPKKTYGDLSSWATQGVLLWNTCLTTQVGEPGAHHNQGWEWVTEHVIDRIASYQTNVAFLLWGNHAKKYRGLIDKYASARGHLILESSHPSPLSVRRGFATCHHFERVNEWRTDTLGQRRIRWDSPQVLQRCQRIWIGKRILFWWRRWRSTTPRIGEKRTHPD